MIERIGDVMRTGTSWNGLERVGTTFERIGTSLERDAGLGLEQVGRGLE